VSAIIYVTQGDTGPDITLTLTDHDTGVPIDVTDVATSVLKFRAVNTTTILATITLAITGNPENGQLLLVWPPGTLNVTPGFYEGEITLTDVDGKIITAFTHPRFLVQAQY
jgi:hypothetical protein